MTFFGTQCIIIYIVSCNKNVLFNNDNINYIAESRGFILQ